MKGTTMLTKVEKHLANENAKQELSKLLVAIREEGYLERSPVEPCATLLSRVIATLEKIEKERPGALAGKTPPRAVLALRRVAAMCVEAARRERSKGLTAPLGALARRQ